MTPRYHIVPPGKRVLDYDHPHTRSYIRAALWRLSDDGHMPHYQDWRALHPEDLPENLHGIYYMMGFGGIGALAEWAGLLPAKRRMHDWRATVRVVGEWVDRQRALAEAEAERIAAEADAEYGYGLKVCDTPRTVMAFDARSRTYQQVEAVMLR